MSYLALKEAQAREEYKKELYEFSQELWASYVMTLMELAKIMELDDNENEDFKYIHK